MTSNIEEAKAFLETSKRMNLSILDAQEEYKSQTKLVDPRAIDDEINHKLGILDKLRFTYLESMSREELLRKIDDDDLDIGQSEIRQIEQETTEAEKEYQKLETELYLKVNEHEQDTREILELYKTYESEIQVFKDLLDDAEALENELQSMINSCDPDVSLIIQSKLDQENPTGDFESEIEWNKLQTELEQKQLDELSKQKDEIKAQLREVENEKEEIRKRLLNLKTKAALSANSQDQWSVVEKGTQEYAQFAKHMSEILLLLSAEPKDIKVQQLDSETYQLDVYPYKMSKISVVYTRKFNIISIDGIKDTNKIKQFIHSINSFVPNDSIKFMDLVGSFLAEFIGQ
ncbi:uncharacterized protein J8A68_004898 [[Candida] subhashii]|uniref:Spindle pole body component KRE28 n=1 Tax=[Candida] subhashii TaxID=561895 RepID=A0A8J5QGC3_9ASCO|nr:uncharacterized protein J8A68_004898 [[Candida] subhashii]KAG7661629.1 hypothetical protein J8A68_004898 [[Candida] subhashii]